MNEEPVSQTPDSIQGEGFVPQFRTLRELIDQITGKAHWQPTEMGDAGLAELLPFPFLALVGQREMKLALLIALVNPAVGGVLLIGPRGTGKTTAVRSLVDLLPETPRSLCYYGCMPDDIEIGGIEAVCPDCARKFAMGEPLFKLDKVHLVELPLNARLDDVVGGIDERLAAQDRLRMRKGILAQADRNLLYVDEVNLLADEVVDAILDASAQGSYTVRRGPLSATFRSRFVLIGSMNPEEGRLRPQIMDRFGLRVVVHGLTESSDRLEVYRRVQAYQAQPRSVVRQFAEETAFVQNEIQFLRDTFSEVTLPDQVAGFGLELINRLKLDSSRAEITLFEAARAFATLDSRKEVTEQDIFEVAPMTLRMRRSVYMEEYFSNQEKEEKELTALLQGLQRTPPDS
jgi:magnesium chelatase subunit I